MLVTAKFTWAELVAATEAEILQVPAELNQTFSPSTDTRKIEQGAVYFPIVGERFDGHSFIDQAVQAGARAIVLQKEQVNADVLNAFPPEVGVLAVSNTTHAYLAIARHHRRRCKAVIVGLTGSSGKTTTKDMLYQALSPYITTQCTQKNFNNEMGVAQTLLSLQGDTDILIVEMGMRGLGEIELLSRYAEPNMAIIVNIGPAHIGRLGSMNAIAQAKSEIVIGLTPLAHDQQARFPKVSPCCVYDGDSVLLEDALNSRCAEHALCDLVPVYRADVNELTVTATSTAFRLKQQPFVLPQPGEHLATNTQLMIEIVSRVGVSLCQVAEGLNRPVQTDDNTPQGRWQVSEGLVVSASGYSQGVCVINDAYNANPQSMLASLTTVRKTLQAEPNRVPVCIMGGMKELGELSEKYHHDIGKAMASMPELHAGFLMCLGEESKGIWDACHHCFEDRHVYLPWRTPPSEAMLDAFLNTWQPQWIQKAQEQSALLTVWLKGSRFYQLEAIAARMTEQSRSLAHGSPCSTESGSIQ